MGELQGVQVPLLQSTKEFQALRRVVPINAWRNAVRAKTAIGDLPTRRVFSHALRYDAR